MPISQVLPVDTSGNKTKVKLQYFASNDSGEIFGGSVLVRYVSAVDDSDLPAGGTAQEQRIKTEVEMSLASVINRYINPPSLVFVDPLPEDMTGLRTVGRYISERRGTQLTGVPADQDLKEQTEGVFKKLVEVMQANGLLPI